MKRIIPRLTLFAIVLSLLACEQPAAAQPRMQAVSYRVLFDNAHAETAGNADWVISRSQPDPLRENASPEREGDWTGGLSAWGVALQQTGRYRLATNTNSLTFGASSNALDLANFDVLVLPEPNKLLTSAEKQAVRSFVQAGGGLFIIADHDRSDRNNDGADSLRVLNDLMAGNPFGLQFDVADVKSENLTASGDDPLLQGPFGTVKRTLMRGGTTMTLDRRANDSVRGVIYRNNFSGDRGAFVARSESGKGRVVAIGDSSPADDGTCAATNLCIANWGNRNADNAAIFLNGTEWLAAAEGSGPPPQPTAGVGGERNLIQNGGFEDGATAWRVKSSSGRRLIDTEQARSGQAAAHLCGANNCTDSLYQSLTIPANASSVTLRYYWRAVTTETTHRYDFLYARIRNSSGQPIADLQTVSDADAGDWQAASFDLSRYRGQTIQLSFAATNGKRNPTAFYVDDVSVTVK